jgi:hypothetical protein
VGEVLLAGEEAHEGAAFLCDVIADGPSENRVARLKGVENGTLRNRGCNLELHLAFDFCQLLEMEWECEADHAVQEIPIVKTQAPNNPQISMTKNSSPAGVAHLGIGLLDFAWDLVFGTWDLLRQRLDFDGEDGGKIADDGIPGVACVG